MLQENIEPKNVRYWQYLNGEDFKKLDKSKCVVVVTCSPMEVHGPHLPVITDNLEGEAIATRVIEIFGNNHPDIMFLRLPPMYVATGVLPYSGSLHFKASTITSVLSDLGRTLCKQGFRDIWVANFHGGVHHFLAIDMAVHKTNKKYDARMVSLFSLMIKHLSMSKQKLGEELGHIAGVNPEDFDGDYHAGVMETSMLLHLLGDKVDNCYKDCEHLTVDIKRARENKPPLSDPAEASIFQMLGTLAAIMKYFQEETYSGIPHKSTPEIGKEIIDTLSGLIAGYMEDIWSGKLPLNKIHSPAWPARLALNSRIFQAIFDWIAGLKNPIF